MTKNRLFLLAMVIVSALLIMVRTTGLIPHIIISLIGLLIIAWITVKTKAEWKKPAMEVVMRILYLVAIISGGMLMGMHGAAAVGIIHKISAALFLILMLVLYIPKLKK